jgi:hypothetical protein
MQAQGHEAGRNITPIYANARSHFETKSPFSAKRLAVTQNRLSAPCCAPWRRSSYQLATDLLKMSVMILSVVVRTAVGSLLMVAMLRPAG